MKKLTGTFRILTRPIIIFVGVSSFFLGLLFSFGFEDLPGASFGQVFSGSPDESLLPTLWQFCVRWALFAGILVGSSVREEMAKQRAWMLPGLHSQVVAAYSIAGVAIAALVLLLLRGLPLGATHLTFVAAAYLLVAIGSGGVFYAKVPRLSIALFIGLALVVLRPSLLRVVADAGPIPFGVACLVVAAYFLSRELRRVIWRDRTEAAISVRPEFVFDAADQKENPKRFLERLLRQPSTLTRTKSPRLWPYPPGGDDLTSYLRAVAYENGVAGKPTIRQRAIAWLVIVVVIMAWTALPFFDEGGHSSGLTVLFVFAVLGHDTLEPRLLRVVARQSRARVIFRASTRKTAVLFAFFFSAFLVARYLLRALGLEAGGDPDDDQEFLILGMMLVALMPLAHWIAVVWSGTFKAALMSNQWSLPSFWLLAGAVLAAVAVLVVTGVFLVGRGPVAAALVLIPVGVASYTWFNAALKRRYARADLVRTW